MGGGGVLADAGDQLQALLAIASSNPTALVSNLTLSAGPLRKYTNRSGPSEARLRLRGARDW